MVRDRTRGYWRALLRLPAALYTACPFLSIFLYQKLVSRKEEFDGGDENRRIEFDASEVASRHNGS